MPLTLLLLKVGVFKDSNVAGMRYKSESGYLTGFTSKSGTFTFYAGDNVTFSIGTITIGTAQGKSVVTPIDLIPGSSASSPTVSNIVRFLLALDSDQNPDNGIDIATKTFSEAASWTGGAIDFTTSNFGDINGNETLFIQNQKSATGLGTSTLTTVVNAQNHLEDTLQCSYSGGYVGHSKLGQSDQTPDKYTIRGDDFIIMVGADGTTTMAVIDNGNIDNEVDIPNGEYGYQNINFFTLTSIDFSKNILSTTLLSSYGIVTATLNDVNNMDTSFKGGNPASRIGGDINAKYRYTGIYAVSSLTLTSSLLSNKKTGLFAFDIDANNIVTGKAYDIVSHEAYTMSGAVTNGILTIESEQNGAIVAASATIDLDADTISNGVWSHENGVSGVFIGSGCRLN